jgi:hypothetical protein
LKSSLENELEECLELNHVRKEQIIPKYEGIDTTELANLLIEFDNSGSFAYKIEDLKEGCRMEPIMLKLIDKNHPPIRIPTYRTSIKEKKVGREKGTEMLRSNMISHSNSPWNFPIIFVPMSDDDLRKVTDYRKLNAILITEDYPVTRILDVLDDLGGAVYFSQLDFSKSFLQFWLAEECRELTAFTIEGMGKFHYNRLPLGIKKSPAIHDRMIASILGHLPFVRIYFDDITIFSKEFDEHVDHVRQVLTILREVNLKINPDKCTWAVKEIKILDIS